MKNMFYFCLISIFITQNITTGFSAETQVNTNGELLTIKQLQVNDYVDSFDKNRIVKKIMYTQLTKEAYCSIELNNSEKIICSLFQKFYLSDENKWIYAKDLKKGHLLFSLQENITVKSVRLIDEKAELFDITVEETHNFFITKNGILVHNFVPVVIGISFLFGSGAIEFAGATIGITAMGILACFTVFGDKKHYHPRIDIVSDPKNQIQACSISKNDPHLYTSNDKNGAQAPGIPTEKDGYHPPKNWDGKKVRHKRGWGYPDKKGNIWIPSGPNGHGGPHWDVQYPDGNYDNVVPGGYIRGSNKKFK